MADLDALVPYFPEINAQLDHAQLVKIHNVFLQDFVENTLMVNEKIIHIDQSTPKPNEYNGYTNTFYHIVTRAIETYKTRVYECERANRVHWIRPILESHPCKDILYFKYRDKNGRCREHFWLIHKKFMVVLAETTPGMQIVTSFCVDDDRRDDYYAKFDKYRNGNCDCP